LGLSGRLVYLQVVKHEEYLRLAESQHAKAIPLTAKRGAIMDRHGQVLAVSSAAETLFALPRRVDDAERLARRLAPILDEPVGEIARRLQSSKRFVYVKRRLPPAVAQAVRDLREPALGFVEESLRLYPNRELAATWSASRGPRGRGSVASSRSGRPSWPDGRAGRSSSAMRSGARCPELPGSSSPPAPGR
ncbi:MAG: hypothetical protein AAB328_09960, partial [candidate division NC10 bacterium]